MRLVLRRNATRLRARSQATWRLAESFASACSAWPRSIWRCLNSASFAFQSVVDGVTGPLGGVTLGVTLEDFFSVFSSGGGLSEKCVVPFSSTHLYIVWAPAAMAASRDSTARARPIARSEEHT